MTSSKKHVPEGFRLTKRDYEIVQTIALCGALTAGQIALYHFGPALTLKETQTNAGSVQQPELVIHSNCQRRMKLLREAGLVQRIQQYQLLSEGKKPYLYTVTPRGVQQLADFLSCRVKDIQWRKKDPRIRPNYVEHLIMTNNVRLAIMRMVKVRPGIELVTWRDELMLAKDHSEDKIPVEYTDGSRKKVVLIPDAYFVLRDPGGKFHHHFLEVDRGTTTAESSTETYRTWGSKIKTYITYLYSDLYTGRYKTDQGRVITVTTSQQRLERLVGVSEKAGARTRFWFTAMPSLRPLIQRRRNEDGTEQSRRLDEDGIEIVQAEDYEVVVPDMLLDPIWTLATDSGKTHAFGERFILAHQDT